MKWAGWSGWPDVNPIIPGLPAFECTAALDQRVIREVDLLFAPVAQRVDDYLDWYFTVLGEYERLTGAVMGDFAKHMEQKFAEELFTATDFHARLAGIDQGLAQDALAQMTAVSHVVKEHLAAQVQAQPCVLVALDPQGLDQLNRDQWRAGGAALTGVVTGTTMVVIGKNLVAAVVAKVAICAPATARGGSGVKQEAETATTTQGRFRSRAPAPPLCANMT